MTAEEAREAPRSLFGLLMRSATGWLIAANLAIFAAITWKFGIDATEKDVVLAAFGAKWNPLIHRGEWWRLVACVFLHSGYLHLLLNMFALMNMGLVLEVIVGTRLFLAIYVAAGVCGSAGSMFGNEALSIGASGAIFGIGGALLVLGYLAPHRVPVALHGQVGRGAVPFVVGNVVFGAAIPGIDNHAHLGGLVGGALITAIILLLVKLPRVFGKIAWALCGLAVGVMGWGLTGAVRNLPAGLVAVDVWQFGFQAVRPLYEVTQKYEAAIKDLTVAFNAKKPLDVTRAPAVRQAVLAILDERARFRKTTEWWPPSPDPEVRVAMADLKAKTVPLDAMKIRVAKFADRTLAADLLTDAREHFEEWKILIQGSDIDTGLKAIFARLHVLHPPAAKDDKAR